MKEVRKQSLVQMACVAITLSAVAGFLGYSHRMGWLYSSPFGISCRIAMDMFGCFIAWVTVGSIAIVIMAAVCAVALKVFFRLVGFAFGVED